MTSEPDRLNPWDITEYGLQEERTTCAHCHAVTATTRMWMTYHKPGVRNLKVTRPVGASEQIYANIPIKRNVHQQHTAACPACIATIKLEQWQRPEATSEAAAARPRGGMAASAGYGARPAGSYPTKPKPQSIADILAAAGLGFASPNSQTSKK